MQTREPESPKASRFAKFDSFPPAKICVQRGHRQAAKQKADGPLPACQHGIEGITIIPIRTSLRQHRDQYGKGKEVQRTPAPIRYEPVQAHFLSEEAFVSLHRQQMRGSIFEVILQTCANSICEVPKDE